MFELKTMPRFWLLGDTVLQLPRASVRRAAGLHATRGATAIEYALMASLIAVVIFGVVALLGGTVLGLFQNAADVI
ncbi:MAG: hypothetical protein NVS3B26_10230 [Mycobacteriales bacterium]